MLPPTPIQDDLIGVIDLKAVYQAGGKRRSRMSETWLTWLRSLVLAVEAASQALGQVTVSAATAAAAPTDIATPTLNAGLYRISWYARISTPASISSSLTVTIHWLDGGVACQFSGPAMTGNVATDIQSQSILVQVDNNTVIQYETAYASVGTNMGYLLDVVVEAVA